nr:histone-lysine N-methyltransferase SETMAR-like [Lepeophtheirus salmonis]
MGKNTVQACLGKCYPDSAPSKTTIKRWFADFKRGRTDLNDAERPGRPNEADIPVNIENTLKIIMGNRHMGMKKLFFKWGPRVLTPDQKQQREDDSKSCLEMFTRNKKEFLRWYITIDETWIHQFTPESKRQSAEWYADGEIRPKTQTSAGKIMASVFWDSDGILFIDYLEHRKTIHSD